MLFFQVQRRPRTAWVVEASHKICVIDEATVVKDEQKDKCCQRWQCFKHFETHCYLHITVAGVANYGSLGPILLRPSSVYLV